MELFDVGSTETVQGDLRTGRNSDHRKTLMACADQINAAQGRATIRFAATGSEQGGVSMPMITLAVRCTRVTVRGVRALASSQASPLRAFGSTAATAP